MSRELRRLEQVEMVQSEKRANLRYYRSIKNTFSLYEEQKGLFIKTVRAPAKIKEALKGIEEIETALIYGSLPKGEKMSGSDIDRLIVGDIDIDKDKFVQGVPNLER